jgi:hypothetical protein
VDRFCGTLIDWVVMGQRHNHYEAAFEEWVREARIPYVMVDEKRRALADGGSMKSLDFILSRPGRENLLVDVKGRKYPGSHRSDGGKWTNWAHQEDLHCMLEWEQLFGSGFRALLVFAYEVLHPEKYPELEPYFAFRNRYYSFFGVWADDYRARDRLISPSWETVGLTADEYRAVRFPLHELLTPPESLEESGALSGAAGRH